LFYVAVVEVCICQLTQFISAPLVIADECHCSSLLIGLADSHYFSEDLNRKPKQLFRENDKIYQSKQNIYIPKTQHFCSNFEIFFSLLPNFFFFKNAREMTLRKVLYHPFLCFEYWFPYKRGKDHFVSPHFRAPDITSVRFFIARQIHFHGEQKINVMKPFVVS
jgi:hypothetical protein